MKKTGLLIFFSSLYFLRAIGQVGPPSPNDQALRKTLVEPAEYIFEGTVLQTKNYTTKEGWMVTQAILDIHKVFKGELNPGTVEMVTGPSGYFYVEDNYPKFNPWVTIRMSHGQSLGFEVGRTDLFLAQKEKNIPSNTDCPVSNKEVIREFERFQYFLNPREFYIDYEAFLSGGQILQGKQFMKLQDLYNFILVSHGTILIDFDHKTFVKLGRDGQPVKN